MNIKETLKSTIKYKQKRKFTCSMGSEHVLVAYISGALSQSPGLTLDFNSSQSTYFKDRSSKNIAFMELTCSQQCFAPYTILTLSTYTCSVFGINVTCCFVYSLLSVIMRLRDNTFISYSKVNSSSRVPTTNVRIYNKWGQQQQRTMQRLQKQCNVEVTSRRGSLSKYVCTEAASL